MNNSDQNQASLVEAAIRNRRTINFFEETVPPRKLVMEAIDAARWVPNHHLTEPWRFYLLSGQSKNAIVELNAELVGNRKGPQAAEAKRQRWSSIPGWLVVTCTRDPDELRAREDYAATCCAIYAILLQLWTRGVGSKWTTGDVTRDPRFYDAIWVDPDQESVVGLIWYGYPAEVPVTARKSLSEILLEI